jgi:hypothetical protein
MGTNIVALIAFVCIFGGALVGWLLRRIVPAHHMSEDVRDVVRQGAGLIATLAALVLGLMVSSAKSTLDTMNSELTQSSVKIMMLDRAMAEYGPETKDIRTLLRDGIATTIELIWPDEKSKQAHVKDKEITNFLETVQNKLRALQPQNDSQRYFQPQALQLTNDLAQSRWLLSNQTQQTPPPEFLVVLLFWLTVLFVLFGMLAPPNQTVIAVLLICALSVSGAILLIMEMSSPLDGVIKVSSASFHKTYNRLGN